MKNIALITLLLFIYSCGYTSVYKDLEQQDFELIITETKGDKSMNNFIKNEINLSSNKNSNNKFNIEIETNYRKTVLTKNNAGSITDYELSVNTTFLIKFNQKSKKITLNEKINIKNQIDGFEQNSYENNIKRNFASSIREKLISEIITLK